MKTDPDFKDNQRVCNKKWAANHPGYWKQYRWVQSHLDRSRNRHPTGGVMWTGYAGPGWEWP
jgi:hypothetical protein